MTSRPPAGTHRPPQRPLSGTGGTGAIQRTTVPRSLSQQYSLPASIRNSDNFIDLTLDGPEVEHYGFPRVERSRLKLELSRDPKEDFELFESPVATDTTQKQHNPRGRPRLRFEGDQPPLQTNNSSSLLPSIGGVEKIIGYDAMPMPKRPVQSVPSSVRGKKQPGTNTVKKDLRPKAYILETPPAAPHYLPDGHADFFPWSGGHPEDQFTEAVIRQGFSEKSQAMQNEIGSAKLSILPALKNKSGLQTLSSLFTSVLSHRRTHGQITSTPTFKPPPRVTLTDTKRETWLRDLASPNISLRRLSRTIPHGIRGKVLLEQCLSKRIPTERAVWLAKCVGANEIRAFKRKGVTGTFALGGEAKWIRDWTIFVEQFIESVVASCGETDWKGRTFYAVRLAAHLYSEHLLDREHYLDWISTSLEACTLAKAPIWILITQVYWSDLLKYRKYGRRLVAAMCAHLQMADENLDRDLLLPLIERITALIEGLLATSSENFVSIKLWTRYKTTLASCLFSGLNYQQHYYRSIDERNKRLMPTASSQNSGSGSLVVELLDKYLSQPFTIDLSQRCREAAADAITLAQVAISWSTSLHRPGLAKVYIAARLLKTWCMSGLNVNDAILRFLGSEGSNKGLCKESFYHLVSELARSEHFSISKYLQWLIARGGVRSPADLASDGPCATRLLAELPTHGLPDSIKRLRRMVLNRAEFSLDHELAEIDKQTRIVERHLRKQEGYSGYKSDFREVPPTKGPGVRRYDLSRTIKSEIGVCVRKAIDWRKVHSSTGSNGSWKEEAANHVSTVLTVGEFNLTREILESIQDLSTLADVLRAVTFSDDFRVLAAAADTLNRHAESFAAIGSLHDLFEGLLLRLRSLSDGVDSPMLLSSLADLASRIPGLELVTIQLSAELVQSHRRTAADACSPVSDHMAEALQDSDSDLSDEIDKVLASGTSMEQSTLQSLFEMIVSQIEASWVESTVQPYEFALLLMRLRYFDAKYFDSLMMDWLRKLLHGLARPSLTQVLGPLISVGCLDFKQVIASSGAFLSDNGVKDHSIIAKVAVETLFLLLGTPDGSLMVGSNSYHLDVKRAHLRQNHHQEALSAIRRAIESTTPSTGQEYDYMCLFCGSRQMRDFLRQVVLDDLDSVLHELVIPLGKSPRAECRQQINDIINGLLYFGLNDDFDEKTIVYRIEHALQSANDLTLPFCQLELQLILITEAPEWSNEDDDTSGYLEAFERAVDLATEHSNRSWTRIIPALDVQIARHLCQRAERLLLQLVPSFKAQDLDTADPIYNDELANRQLFVVNATMSSMEANRSLNLASQIAEKLNDLWQISSQGSKEARMAVIVKWLPLMLEFIALHLSMFDMGKITSEVRSRMLLSLTSLFLEYRTHPETNSTLLERLFDVAILLVDDLPEGARLNCARSLRDKISDRRLRYIFGYPASPMDWLYLNQKGKLVSYQPRRWEILSEPTPNVGENDTSLSLTLFQARRL